MTRDQPMAGAAGRRVSRLDFVVFAAFLAVPLAVSPVLGDPFTGVKWYVLELLAIVWLAVEAFARPAPGAPRFLRRHATPLAALAALTVASALRGGFGWSLEPLLARATFVALALCSYAHFSRNGRDTSAVRRGLTASLAAVTALGLAQVLGATQALGLEPRFGLASGDGRSATFGNANMAAQFVGFALAWRVASRAARSARGDARAWAHDVLDAAALGYVVLAGARSAMLAVALAFLTTLVVTGRRGASAVLRPLLLAALAALPLVALFAGPPGDTAQPGALGHPLKEESLRIRLRVWQGTAALILDRPLGAGSGNFLHAFLPYQLRDERLRSEEVVYSSPHSEILRALAEEGLAWCALAAYLFWRLCTAVWRRARVDGWTPAEVVVAAGAAFLAVESAFQFPFAMALGSLAAAVLLGLALTLADADAPAAEHARRRTATRFALLAAAAVASAALARLVVSDHLAGARPHAVRAQRRACDLDPRNLRACLRAAWLDARAGNRPQARGRLAAVLDRSPYYYPAVKLLADESLAQGDATAGCFHLWVYDALFAGRSAEHARLARLCDPAWLETYRLAVPVPGYERFPILVPAGSPD